MATKAEAVKEETPESSGTTETEGVRSRSTIAFPYLDLDDAIEISKGVHTVGGSTCLWDQLAGHFQQAAQGGGFRLRVQTAKMYGLVTYDRGTVALTPLGSRICDPDQEKAARADSFLTIPLYKKLYEEFKGGTLPPTSGLETAIVNLGVAIKQKDKARQVFQRSAKLAGFFDVGGTSRLIMPSLKASTRTTEVLEEQEHEDEEPPEPKHRPEEPHAKRHPLIDGLLKELPEPQTEWTTEDRKKWLEMASTIFNVIYKDSDDSRGSLKVVVEKTSAK